MDYWIAVQALILGIVEGLTEFLPISSTGHQIIVADLLGFGGDRAMAFNIIIQLGAILAVVWEYRRKILDVVVGLPKQAEAQQGLQARQQEHDQKMTFAQQDHAIKMQQKVESGRNAPNPTNA